MFLDPSALNKSNHGPLTGLTPEQREGLDTEGLTPAQCKAVVSWKQHHSLSPVDAYYSPVTEEEGVMSKNLYSEKLVSTLKKICALYPGQTVILSLGGGGLIHALRARAWMKKGALADYTKSDVKNACLYVIQGTPDVLFVEGEEL